MRWNREQPDWPSFRCDNNRLESREASFLHSAGLISGLIKHLDAGAGEQLRMELIGGEAIQTSAIEGEIPNRSSQRPSPSSMTGAAPTWSSCSRNPRAALTLRQTTTG